MASINVNRGLSDQFYRYKMPKLQAKVEGKGNGIKTVIVNMVDIAKALNRPPMYPTKYFGCVLGAQVNCDVKNERYIVNGAHDANKLQDLLDGFIQKYVLCQNCQNPETVLAVSKKGMITTSCKACGFNGTISSQDKLTTYIVKYPPSVKPAAGPSLQPPKSAKKEKKSRDSKKGNGENGGSQSPKNDSDENGDDGKNGREADDEDWVEDTDAEAVARRMQLLSTGAKGLMYNDDLEKSSEERFQMFFEFIKKKKLESENGSFDATTQKEILTEAVRLEIRDKAVLALIEVLFDENILAQIKQHRNLFLRFTSENEKAQKYLLRGFEMTVKLYKKDLLPKVAHVLKAFYDADILEERVILDWGSKVSKKAVGKEMAEEIRSKAGPFLKWLKEAEEEDDSDGDDDSSEEDVVVYDPKVTGSKIVVTEVQKDTPVNNKQPVLTPDKNNDEEGGNDDDDIDIDAI